jgi:4-amino-4-deoxy-L-arabinose transferase-like glycosyltransferase
VENAKIVSRVQLREPVWTVSLVLLIGLVALATRAGDLVSDPPPNLGESGGYYADEGFWTHNARNKILFGQFVLDEWNNMFASPLTHWPQYVSFRWLGVGLAQARLFPVMLSMISVFLIARGLRGSASVAAAALFAGNVLLIHFGRLALLETPLVCLLLLSWFLLAVESPGRVRIILSGFVLGLAVVTKLSIVYVAPAAILAMLLRPGDHSPGKAIGFLCIGFAISLIAWLATLGSNLHYFLQYARFYSSQQSPWTLRLVENMAHPVLFTRLRASPLLPVVGFVVAMGITGRIKNAEIPRSVIFATFWFLFGALYLDTLTYRPLRYHIPLFPPMIILVSWAAIQLWHGRERLSPGFWGMVFAMIFLWPIVWNLAVETRPGLRGWHMDRKVVAVACLWVAIYVAWRVGNRILRDRTPRRALVVVLFVAYGSIHVVQYAHWLGTKQREIFSTSVALGSRFDRAVFTGQWSPVLCIENQHRAVPVWPGFVNGSDPFTKHHITHGVIWDRHWERFREWFPEEFAKATILDTLWIKESPVLLCSFPSEQAIDSLATRTGD